MDRKVTDLFFALIRGAALGEKGCYPLLLGIPF